MWRELVKQSSSKLTKTLVSKMNTAYPGFKGYFKSQVAARKPAGEVFKDVLENGYLGRFKSKGRMPFGQRKEYLSNAKSMLDQRDLARHSSKQSLLSNYQQNAKYTPEQYTTFKKALGEAPSSLRDAKRLQLKDRMYAATQEKNLTEAISGRHGLKPGEVSLPYLPHGISPTKVPQQNILFRGNAPVEGQVNWGSLHPEVASSYSLYGPVTEAQRKMYAFKHTPGPKMITQPADYQTFKGGSQFIPGDPNSIFKPGYSQNIARQSTQGSPVALRNPTYETVIAPGGYGPQLGEYSTRLTRGAQGQPIQAISRVSGMDLKQLLGR